MFVSGAILLLCIVCCHAQTPLQTRRHLEDQRAAIQKEIEEVKSSLSQAHRNKRETLGQLALLQRKLRLRESSIQNINAQIGLIQQNMDESSRSIGDLRRELDTLRVQYAESVVFAYKNRTGYGVLSFIFSAGSFYDALKRMEYLNQYRAFREQRAADIMRMQDTLQGKIDGLRATRVEKDVVLQKQSKEKKILEQEKKEKDAVVTQLGSREKELQRQMAAKQKKDQQLASLIEAAIRKARDLAIREAKRKAAAAAAMEKARAASAARMAAADRVRAEKERTARASAEAANRRLQSANNSKNSGSGGTAGAGKPGTAGEDAGNAASASKTGVAGKSRDAGRPDGAGAGTGLAATDQPAVADKAAVNKTDEPFNTETDMRLTGSFENNKKRLPWPVTSRTVTMAFGRHQYMGKLIHDNLGITIEADAGSVVRVVFDGEVQAVLDLGDVQAVVVRHGKYFTTYSNLDAVQVAKEQPVKAGQLLGRVSSIGQLEFWLSDDKDHWLDPEKWLR